jgi:hypothetical protein
MNLSIIQFTSILTMNVAANTVFHERTKHLDIDSHVVRLKVYEGLMELLSIPTTSQVFDIFTEASIPCFSHQAWISGYFRPSSLCWGNN